MQHQQLAELLKVMGCPPEKCGEMASQLDKRACQLMTQKGQSYEHALAHLLTMMRQGWSAKERGF